MNLLEPTSFAARADRLRPAPRIPLLAAKVIDAARRLIVFAPGEAALDAARTYAQALRSPQFQAMKEELVRPKLIDEI